MGKVKKKDSPIDIESIKGGNVQTVNVHIDQSKTSKSSGGGKKEVSKEKKAELEKLLKATEAKIEVIRQEKKRIGQTIGFIPPIAIPSMPQPVRNPDQMTEQLRGVLEQLNRTDQDLIELGQRLGIENEEMRQIVDGAINDTIEHFGNRFDELPNLIQEWLRAGGGFETVVEEPTAAAGPDEPIKLASLELDPILYAEV